MVLEEQAGKEEQGVGRQLVLPVASCDTGEECPSSAESAALSAR